MKLEYIEIKNDNLRNNFRMYKGVKIEYYYYGCERHYQTTFANIGRYSTLKEIQKRISEELKK